jgi:hypothetical protein
VLEITNAVITHALKQRTKDDVTGGWAGAAVWGDEHRALCRSLPAGCVLLPLHAAAVPQPPCS